MNAPVQLLGVSSDNTRDNPNKPEGQN